MSHTVLSGRIEVILRIMIVALTLQTTAVFAQNTTVMIRGQGAGGCGKWVDFIARDDPARLTSADTYKAWVLGYLSGMAGASELNFWGRAGVNQLDSESVFLWISNYCRANPLKLVFDAADALFLERCSADNLPCRR
jgi:hypothetical protein